MLEKFSEKMDAIDTRWLPYRRFAGLALSVFVLLTLLGCVSYLFTWTLDQSVLPGLSIFDRKLDVVNLGGKIGLKMAYLLVSRWFGLAAFAVVFAMSVLALRLVFGKRRFSVLRVIVLSVTGAMLLSYILAFVSIASGMETSFGGGLGGECGAQVVLWLENLVNVPVTFCILLFFSVLWLYFSSRKFSEWFRSVGVSDGKEESARKKSRKTFTWTDAKTDSGDESGTDTENDESASEAPAVAETPVEATVEESEPVASQPVAPQPVVPAEVKPAVSNLPASRSDSIIVEAGPELSTDVVESLPRIDVRAELDKYEFPSLDILGDHSKDIHKVSESELNRNNLKIRSTLQTYKIGVENVVAVVGPTVTLYKVYPSVGVKIASICNLSKELAMALNTSRGVRIVMLPDSVGLEVPNDYPSMVPLKALLNDDEFRNTKADLPVAIGVTITQKVKVFDLANAPHLLVAGATQQGKSVGLNVLVASLLYAKHPSELKLVFVDPKMVEFNAYKDLLHHYLAVLPTASDEKEEAENAIVKKPAQADDILKSLCIEMDERYELLSKASVNNIKLYNDKYRDRHLLPTEGHRYLPYIVTIIDEYADLTMAGGMGGEAKNQSRSITNSIIRLAQKGRAAGIHLVLATQRPSVDIITGVLKTNFPTRISFRVSQMQDSRTILDAPGAEKLIGKGDMLYYAGVDMERIQCAFISNSEINDLNRAIASQTGYKKSYNTPYYLPAPEKSDGGTMIDMSDLDERFEEAARMVVTTQKGSTSDIQRKLGMGYSKAGRVMDQLEAAGIVGPQEGSKPRQVLVPDLATLDTILSAYRK